MVPTRPPAVAGTFYPGTSQDLSALVDRLLSEAPPPGAGGPPKALVVPHAGYVYSGPAAAAGYRWLAPFRDRYRRVILLGPAHRLSFRGLALPGVTAFTTPLGAVPVEVVENLSGLSQVKTSAEAHAREHSLEVQLPFLQRVLGNFTIVPLVVGDASTDEVSAVADRLWGGPETLLVVSTDLSHYHPATQARALDRATAVNILAFRAVAHDRACGAAPLNGFLATARNRGVSVLQTALTNSGETSGDTTRVVGYGSFVFFEGEKP